MTQPATATGPAYPAELTDRPQWLVWRYVTKPGPQKPAKMPYYVNGRLRGWPMGKPRDGKPTEAQPQVEQGHEWDREALATYHDAMLAADAGRYDGVGFAFLPGDGLIGIDLDAVLPADRQAAIVQACGTFAEPSPSGTGVHIIGLGEVETFKSNDVGIEVFCGRQFFTMPGQHDGAMPFDVRPIPAGVLDKLRRTVEQAKEAARAAKQQNNGDVAERQGTAHPHRGTSGAGSNPAVTTQALHYCHQALQSAVQRISGQQEGGRNDALNAEAYGLGQLLHLGVLSETTVRAELAAAAAACGLPPGEAEATIRSGLRAGQDSPRALPERERPITPGSGNRPPARAPAITPQSVDPETGEILEPANDNHPSPGHDLAAVDWYSPFPDTNGKGKPLGTIDNVREACRRLGVTVRYNVIAKEVEILIPGEGFSIDNQANASLAWLTSACTRFGVPTGPLGDFLTYLADRNQFNPVARWVTSTPWDGQPRLQLLMDSIVADGQDDLNVLDLKEAMIRRWMISAIAGAFRPEGVSAHGVLVLQGDQYLGKTKWFKSLVPAELGVIQDGLMLRPDDRDSVKQAVSYWLVELGELDATFRKSDIAQLKAFITRDKDTLRRAYAKLESHYARRTVFFASVNPRQFLHDPTGNRRYWTISCQSINFDHGLDMQQVWAEVYEEHYLKGEGWFLAPEEMQALNDHNKDHEVLDPIRERMLTRYDWQEPRLAWRWLTATDIMMDLGFDKPNKADVTACGQIVLELNGGESKKSNGKRLSRVPPKNM